jgi:hypothetical protein
VTAGASIGAVALLLIFTLLVHHLADGRVKKGPAIEYRA